jgi:hypothetical protein
MGTLACSVFYNIGGQEQNVPIIPVGGLLTALLFSPNSFSLNDVVVSQNAPVDTADSSYYLTSNVILSPLRKNHSTVGDACVAGGSAFFSLTGAPCTTGTGVIGAIQAIEPVQ